MASLNKRDSRTITVCIPTFNRPLELKRALESVLSQTYTNIEILIADNASTHPQVQEICLSYSNVDNRIRYIRNDINIGASQNFYFLISQVQTNYFVWLGDDDYWSQNYLESLEDKMDSDTVLVFPNVCLVGAGGNIATSGFKRVYGNCVTNSDYLDSWSSHGSGYPVYGLYNLKCFYESGLNFKFEENWVYFNEGIFLHRLFLNGNVRYCESATLFYSTTSVRPSKEKLLDSYFEYTRSIVQLYHENTTLEADYKNQILTRILLNHFCYVLSLCDLNSESLRSISFPVSLKGFMRIVIVQAKILFKKWKLQLQVDRW